jgi:hypothetical protein
VTSNCRIVNLTLHRLANAYTVFYNEINLPTGQTSYEFKLGDFGLATIYRPGPQEPLPSALSSLHQNWRFSTQTYDPEDDLYGIGHLMIDLQHYLLERVDHPDPQYQKLSWHLKNKTELCNVDYALRVAEQKCHDLTTINIY